MEITDIVTRKGCAVDLATQLMEKLNVQSKIAIKMDKILKKDWGNVGICKDKKKVLQKRPSSYIKAVKANKKRRANCLEQIEETWSVNDCNRFHRLHYLKSSEIFFQYITMVVKLFQTSCH